MNEEAEEEGEEDGFSIDEAPNPITDVGVGDDDDVVVESEVDEIEESVNGSEEDEN